MISQQAKRSDSVNSYSGVQQRNDKKVLGKGHNESFTENDALFN